MAGRPSVVMPHDYDIWPFILRTMPAEAQQFPAEVQPVSPEDVFPKTIAYVSKKLVEGQVKATYFMPEHHTWYHYDRVTKQVAPGSCDQGR
jgi:hypothetical protein